MSSRKLNAQITIARYRRCWGNPKLTVVELVDDANVPPLPPQVTRKQMRS